MKANEKVLITDLTQAIEKTISPAAGHSKKIINAIEKSAKKLAHKLIRTIKKADKSLRKARHKKTVRAGSNQSRRQKTAGIVLSGVPA